MNMVTFIFHWLRLFPGTYNDFLVSQISVNRVKCFQNIARLSLSFFDKNLNKT